MAKLEIQQFEARPNWVHCNATLKESLTALERQLSDSKKLPQWIDVKIPWSKADRKAKGVPLTLWSNPLNPELCPVTALFVWLMITVLEGQQLDGLHAAEQMTVLLKGQEDGDERLHEVGDFSKIFCRARSNFDKIMANFEPDIPAVFEDSGDEGSFEGFEGIDRDGYNSDVDFVGLEDDGGGPAPGGTTDDEEEEARWTDHLSDFQVPAFQAPTGLNFNLPDNPSPLDYFRLGRGLGKMRQLKFRTNLAKQLIGGFSCSVSAAQSSKRRKIDAFALEPGNAGKHFIDKIKGRKKECVQCKRIGFYGSFWLLKSNSFELYTQDARAEMIKEQHDGHPVSDHGMWMFKPLR
ncbi:hypothetical protein OS493_000764 [Desmophyllum pertusum]|uniref:Uncharacterized protein n=1 Tax=Desmophyllum pertusum TaxID=174260 RepID=A0A9X0A7U6_9CNID|nr:hypothetical protein OS493_000764 [Desmophyllum pertusum]